MVEDRNPDEENFQAKDEGQAVEEGDLLAVGFGAVEGFVVGDEVLEKEGSDGYDSGERVETAPQE